MDNNGSRDLMIVPFTAIPNIVVRERFLSTAEKLILFYIASMGPTGLTIGTKAFRERLAPMGSSGLLNSIKRLQFLGMITIEQVQKKQGEPAYKKPCHRYFFVRDPLEWKHTVDFRMKLKAEIHRLNAKAKVNFTSEVFADDTHLNESFKNWLASIKPIAYHQRPQQLVASTVESKKWTLKIEKLKSGGISFLKIADDAIVYAAELENLSDGAVVCREKLVYMNLVFDAYEDALTSQTNAQTTEDIEWIRRLQEQGLSSVEISREILRESRRRSDEKNQSG